MSYNKGSMSTHLFCFLDYQVPYKNRDTCIISLQSFEAFLNFFDILRSSIDLVPMQRKSSSNILNLSHLHDLWTLYEHWFWYRKSILYTCWRVSNCWYVVNSQACLVSLYSLITNPTFSHSFYFPFCGFYLPRR